MSNDKNKSESSDDVIDLLMDDFAKKNNVPSPVSDNAEAVAEDSLAVAQPAEQPAPAQQNASEPASDDKQSEDLPFEFVVDKTGITSDPTASLSDLISSEAIPSKVELRAPNGTAFEVLAMDMEDEEVADEYISDEDEEEQFVRNDEIDPREEDIIMPEEEPQIVEELPEEEVKKEAPEDKKSLQVNFGDIVVSNNIFDNIAAEDKVPDNPAPTPAVVVEEEVEQGDILEKICNTKREHVARQKAIVSEKNLQEAVSLAPPPRGFLSAINAKLASGENALIAEVKKASPSKGIIRQDFDPAMIAIDYENAGAACVSVLTDGPYFQGRDEYLNIVSRACKLPVLRKDFIVDEYQVIESRALGADCILLIMAALSLEQAIDFEEIAIALGMDVLVEVHDEQDLAQALQLKSMLIGINNRNLKTMHVDLSVTERLVQMIPSPKTVVCESGIYSHQDILRMNEARVKAFLVGESLMAEDDVKLATERLLGKTL